MSSSWHPPLRCAPDLREEQGESVTLSPRSWWMYLMTNWVSASLRAAMTSAVRGHTHQQWAHWMTPDTEGSLCPSCCCPAASCWEYDVILLSGQMRENVIIVLMHMMWIWSYGGYTHEPCAGFMKQTFVLFMYPDCLWLVTVYGSTKHSWASPSCLLSAFCHRVSASTVFSLWLFLYFNAGLQMLTSSDILRTFRQAQLHQKMLS